MEIQKLRSLAALARTRNYSEAAEQLFTSQSNVSKQILSLEKELGVQLVDRSRRAIVLTEAGDIVLRRASSILNEYDAMLRELERGCKVRMLCLPVMAHYGLTSLISEFQKQWPQVSISLEEVEGQELPELVRRGYAELAICRADYMQEESFDCLTLYRDRLIAILPAGHPLVRKKTLSLRDLAGESLLQIGESSTLYRTVIESCEQAGFTPDIRYTSRRMENLLAMVADGDGISLMMEQAAKYLPWQGVMAVPLREEIVSELALIRLHRGAHSAGGRKFWDFARAWASERAGGSSKFGRA